MEISQYDGKINFGSWEKKMNALLSHNKVAIALEDDSEKWPEERLQERGGIQSDNNESV